MEQTNKPGTAGTATDSPGTDKRLQQLLTGSRASETRILTRALHWAQEAHKDQQRASGEPYYLHAIAVDVLIDDGRDAPLHRRRGRRRRR